MKLFDFDGMFEKKLAEYMAQHPGKYTEEEWEDRIPALYKKFGDTYLKGIGTTPKGYYAAMDDEQLAAALSAHLKEGVPVSDFLRREIERRGCTDALLALLAEGDERVLPAAVELAGEDPRAIGLYFRLLEEDAACSQLIVERLLGAADAAKEGAISLYERGIRREEMLDVLSRVKARDDRVFGILMKEFRTATDELPVRAGYLAAYGDERALPALLEYIDREDINFLEFRELKYAIEALGGEYTRTRDFSEDPYFLEIAEKSQSMTFPDEEGDRS